MKIPVVTQPEGESALAFTVFESKFFNDSIKRFDFYFGHLNNAKRFAMSVHDERDITHFRERLADVLQPPYEGTGCGLNSVTDEFADFRGCLGSISKLVDYKCRCVFSIFFR